LDALAEKDEQFLRLSEKILESNEIITNNLIKALTFRRFADEPEDETDAISGSEETATRLATRLALAEGSD